MAAHNAECVAANKRPRKRLDQRLMELSGTDWCGNDAPPLTNRKMYVYDDGVYRVFTMQDDGGFVGIGYPNEWHCIIRTKAARLFALWTLKVWVADWFGLRSWLYYIALHHRVGHKWSLEPMKWHRRTRSLTRRATYEEWWNSEEGRQVQEENRARHAARRAEHSDGTGAGETMEP
jgi:hypothetical protein